LVLASQFQQYEQYRKLSRFILFLGAIWKTDEGSSTTKPKGFAYNGCFRQFA
jgi:hypothetical protein